ncbi:MAG: glycosyltransferase [Clostridiales bacterium]|nr:glycosyltransferase [Clostridiales bacterium]
MSEKRYSAIKNIIKQYWNEACSFEPVEKYLIINNIPIRFLFANDTLVNVLCKPFEHLLVKPCDNYVLTVHIFDELSTSIKMPYDIITGENANNVVNATYFFNHEDTHLLYNILTSMMTFIDFPNQNAYYVVNSLETMPYYEKACPMRMLLHWFCVKNNMTLIHSAAISNSDSGYLLAGRGGVGKSTLSMLSLFEGSTLLGDDYVIIENNDHPYVTSIYNTIKINNDMIKLFPIVNNFLVNKPTNEEKGYLFITDIPHKTIGKRFKLEGIIFINRQDLKQVHIEKIPKTRALATIGASTMFQLPGANHSFIKHISKLVKSFPVYEYTLSNQIEKNILGLQTFITHHPLVSVIMAVYNGQKYIKKAIDSVLNQSHKQVELIIVDDGSTDNTATLIKSYKSENISYYYQENSGPGAARNLGINYAKGSLIAFIDHDDVWYKDKLFKQITYHRYHPDVSVLFTKHNLVFEDPTKDYSWVQTIEHQKRYSTRVPSSQLLEKSVLNQLGLFNESLKLGEDFDFLNRIIESSLQIHTLDEILYDKLIHDNNISSDIQKNRQFIFKILSTSIKRKKRKEDVLISLIIPAYNSTTHLLTCLDSVVAQTHSVFEIIIVDDGSTNNTKQLVDSYKDDRIIYCYQENKGIGGARNTGVRKARGNYLAFIDHDDVWVPYKLQIQLERLLFDVTTDVVFGHISQFYSSEVNQAYKSKYICPTNPSKGRHAGTMLIKKEDFLTVGFFDEQLRVGESIDWIGRLDDSQLRSAIIPKVLMYRRMHYNNFGIINKQNRQDFAKVFAKRIKEKRK